MRRESIVSLAVVTALVMAGAGAAPAAFPGHNGLIVFASDTGENLSPQLFSITPGGADRTNLTANRYANYGGVWSPDGRHVAFFEPNSPGSALAVMDADGSRQRRLTDRNLWASDPSWSPDGSWIAYVQAYRPTPGLHIVHPDGTGDRLVGPENGGLSGQPVWSPDGKGLLVVRELGNGVKALTLVALD